MRNDGIDDPQEAAGGEMPVKRRNPGPEGKVHYPNGQTFTNRQARFIEEYVKDHIPVAAALRAGYSPNYINQSVLQVMAVPKIIDEIRRQTGEILERQQVDIDMVINEYRAIAFSDATNYLKKVDGVWVTNIDDIEPGSDAARAISEIMQDEYTEGKDGPRIKRTKLNMHDKMKALEFFVKMFKIVGPERVEVTGKDGGPIQSEAKIDYSDLSAEELEAVVAINERMAAKRAAKKAQ